MSDIKRLAEEAHEKIQILVPLVNPHREPTKEAHAAIDAIAAAGEEAERRYDGFVMMTPAAAESMRDRIDALARQNEALRKALSNLVADADRWRASVEAVIGRQPREDWPALDSARAALKETP